MDEFLHDTRKFRSSGILSNKRNRRESLRYIKRGNGITTKGEVIRGEGVKVNEDSSQPIGN